MIQELLDESRIKANERLAIEFKNCDLDWLVRDIAEELNITNIDRFQVESSGKCIGSWNENYLRRLTENLATNAIKYGEENRKVTFSVSHDDKEAVLKIHNFGEPIPEDQKAELFIKFKRLKTAQTKIGWGIGLAVVKGMVDAHNGTIQVESSQSEGTTFIIKLPKHH
jgi:signal transduction histidine kinase